MSTARIEAVSKGFQSRPGAAPASASGTPVAAYCARIERLSLAGWDGLPDEGGSNPVGVRLADVHMAAFVPKTEGGDQSCVTKGLDPRAIESYDIYEIFIIRK